MVVVGGGVCGVQGVQAISRHPRSPTRGVAPTPSEGTALRSARRTWRRPPRCARAGHAGWRRGPRPRRRPQPAARPGAAAVHPPPRGLPGQRERESGGSSPHITGRRGNGEGCREGSSGPHTPVGTHPPPQLTRALWGMLARGARSAGTAAKERRGAFAHGLGHTARTAARAGRGGREGGREGVGCRPATPPNTDKRRRGVREPKEGVAGGRTSGKGRPGKGVRVLRGARFPNKRHRQEVVQLKRAGRKLLVEDLQGAAAPGGGEPPSYGVT